MVLDIKKKDQQHKLGRLVSGYAWEWKSKRDSSEFDIEIDGLKLKWNSVNHDWVNSPNATNEVGCIHTVQGYDLNYTGVIVGPEISYDQKTNNFIVDPQKYMDLNGRRGIDDIEELKRYIINIYKTLMTRAVLGTYIYVVDPQLREYFKSQLIKSK
jgi:hypothetical protein